MTKAKVKRLAKEMRKYRGQWVLVEDAHVVAASTSIKDAINSLPPEQRSRVRAQYCPTEDYSGATYSAI